MLGMFLILPIFSIYAETLPGGSNHLLIGLALGAYGLTQALLQLPFGMASDRYGRKRVIYFGLLLFAFGSLVAAFAMDITWVIIGRAIQGAGAVSAAVTALVADLTREEHRTKAMAMIGGTIGITFALSLVAGPALNQWIGVPGIFALTGILAVLAIGVVKFVVPDPRISRFHSDAEAAPAKLKEVLTNSQLLRLDFGIFALHAAQMAISWWCRLPSAGWRSGRKPPLAGISAHHGRIIRMHGAGHYLRRKEGEAQNDLYCCNLLHAGRTIAVCRFYQPVLGHRCLAGCILHRLQCAGSQPSISHYQDRPSCEQGHRHRVYNTAQSLGVFLGGVVGGLLSHYYGFASVFLFCSVLMALWLALAVGMQAPPAVKSRMFHLAEGLSEEAGRLLAVRLARYAACVRQ